MRFGLRSLCSMFGFAADGVCVSVTALEGVDVTVMDALDKPLGGADIEPSGRTDQDSPCVGSGVLSSGDGGADVIASSVAVHPLGARVGLAREPEADRVGAPVASSAVGPYGEHGARILAHRVEVADAQGVEGMGLRQAGTGAVPLGPPTGRHVDRGERSPK